MALVIIIRRRVGADDSDAGRCGTSGRRGWRWWQQPHKLSLVREAALAPAAVAAGGNQIGKRVRHNSGAAANVLSLCRDAQGQAPHLETSRDDKHVWSSLGSRSARGSGRSLGSWADDDVEDEVEDEVVPVHRCMTSERRCFHRPVAGCAVATRVSTSVGGSRGEACSGQVLRRVCVCCCCEEPPG